MGEYPRARSEGLVAEAVGDELVVYDEATQMAHALSMEAGSVWRRCDGRSSAKDMARLLGLEEARVAQALDELSAAGLIEQSEGISRRALYKRAAKLGAAAVSAPLVYSVAVRPPSAAASGMCGIFLGQGCFLTYAARDCSGTPTGDSCSTDGAPAGCTCQKLAGPCFPLFSGGSVRFGACT